MINQVAFYLHSLPVRNATIHRNLGARGAATAATAATDAAGTAGDTCAARRMGAWQLVLHGLREGTVRVLRWQMSRQVLGGKKQKGNA